MAIILDNLSELGKLMKKRAKDVLSIQTVIDAKGKLTGKEQQLDSLLASIAAKESVRAVREGKKLVVLEQYAIEDKGLKQ